MSNVWSRRGVLKLAATAAAVPLRRIGLQPTAAATESADKAGTPSQAGAPSQAGTPNPAPVADTFPTQPPELAREMVSVSHFDLKRVKELVEARSSLARASWDWGFGDWESALGAASHMGNRPNAEYLISQGARPSLFSSAMLGQVEVVKAMIAASPGVQRIRGPHGISLLAHAKAGGEQARPVFEFLKSLGDADAEPPLPISGGEIAMLAGTYVFGYGENQRIEVTAEEYKGVASIYSPITWTRKGMMGRPLVHVGDHAFYPAGVPSVRINFAEGDASVVMTVHDPEPVLIAKKKKV
jgi:hypothetical protein